MEDDYQQCNCPAAQLLQQEVELCTRAEEARTTLILKQQELVETIEDMEVRVEDMNEKVALLKEERRELKLNIKELTEQLSEERRRVARYKSQKSNSNNLEITRLGQELADVERFNKQLLEERTCILEEKNDLRQTISVEEKDHARAFGIMKAKYELRVTELENTIQEEQQIRQDSEQTVIMLESKLEDAREQIHAKWRKVDDLQFKLAQKDAEINELVDILDSGKSCNRKAAPRRNLFGMIFNTFWFFFLSSIVLAYLCYDVFLN